LNVSRVSPALSPGDSNARPSVVVASKFLDDLFYTNKFFASVAGLCTAELNRLEASLLIHTDFVLCIAPEEFESYREPADKLARLARAQGELSSFFRQQEYRRRSAIALARHQQQAMLLAAQQAQQSPLVVRLPRPMPTAGVTVLPPRVDVGYGPTTTSFPQSQQAQLQQTQSFFQPPRQAPPHEVVMIPCSTVEATSSCVGTLVAAPATPSNVGSPATCATAVNRKRTLSCSRPPLEPAFRGFAF
jgi:hypothetical protein